MPLFMDIHTLIGAGNEEVARAHEADMSVAHRHGVNCLKYWFNESSGKAFCLFDAPSAEAANAVHREAHGLLAEKIIEVDAEIADGLLGGGDINSHGAAIVAGDGVDQTDSGVRSVLFTDIVDSTGLTQRIGDEAAMMWLAVHDAIVREALSCERGREVKHTGDGIMAAFVSAVSAVRCACRIQAALTRHRQENPATQISVRIGMAAGEPVEQHNDLFGSTVQLAARLCSHAQPGQILVSNVVAELCIGKILSFVDMGAVDIKGFNVPVHVRAVDIVC